MVVNEDLMSALVVDGVTGLGHMTYLFDLFGKEDASAQFTLEITFCVFGGGDEVDYALGNSAGWVRCGARGRGGVLKHAVGHAVRPLGRD